MYKTAKGLASVSLVRRMGKGSYDLAALVKNMVISYFHLMKKDEYLKKKNILKP